MTDSLTLKTYLDPETHLIKQLKIGKKNENLQCLFKAWKAGLFYADWNHLIQFTWPARTSLRLILIIHLLFNLYCGSVAKMFSDELKFCP